MKGALRRLFVEPEPPLLAIEVRPRALGVIRLTGPAARPALGSAASLALAPGVLRSSLTESNIAEPAAFEAALRAVLERAGILGGARVALVLPDTAGRIAILPAGEITGRGRDAGELARFRLKGTLPFEPRDARIAVRPDGAAQGGTLVVAAHEAVLEPYEAACRAAGLEPGLVELASLALVDAIAASRPAGDRLFVNWDDDYVSLLLTRDGRPALARTLAGAEEAQPERVVREAENTLVYYRERLAGEALQGAFVRSGVLPPGDAQRLLAGALGVAVEAVNPWLPSLGASPSLGQELAGAAASLLRRVA